MIGSQDKRLDYWESQIWKQRICALTLWRKVAQFWYWSRLKSFQRLACSSSNHTDMVLPLEITAHCSQVDSSCLREMDERYSSLKVLYADTFCLICYMNTYSAYTRIYFPLTQHWWIRYWEWAVNWFQTGSHLMINATPWLGDNYMGETQFASVILLSQC